MPFTADFETTGETNYYKDGYVRVWLWSLVNCDTMEEWYGTDIPSFLEELQKQKADIVFFHNLRFDGSFLLNYLVDNNYIYGTQYTCIIDKLNVWYEIRLNLGRVVKIWDSLKKYPGCSVQDVADLYGIRGKDEKPNFDTYRPLDYQPTAEEIEYCLQDSRIMAYAIADDWNKGYRGMTLSSDAFKEVKETLGGFKRWRTKMPKLDPIVDKFCRKAYKGGWVYCNPKYQNKEVEDVNVYDVNSLYPYVMSSKPLPVGKPILKEPVKGELFIVQFTTEFTLKEGYFPTIQVKHSMHYSETEYITESVEPLELTMTSIDYELFHKHYNVYYETGHKYVSFQSQTGLLKPYIDKWMKEKVRAVKEHKPNEKFIAKRRLNSPYGKTGMRGDRINKIPTTIDNRLLFKNEKEEIDTVYVPYACFVCAWARYITITTAQQNYNNFLYADTDSVHITGKPHGEMWIDDTELGAWKHEGHFELGKYIRAKTYIHGHKEVVGKGHADTLIWETKVDEIKCAGMPDRIKERLNWEDFYMGAEFYDEEKGIYKIQQKQVRGGCILVKMPFKIRETLMS